MLAKRRGPSTTSVTFPYRRTPAPDTPAEENTHNPSWRLRIAGARPCRNSRGRIDLPASGGVLLHGDRDGIGIVAFQSLKNA
jgi:hypothetical protein